MKIVAVTRVRNEMDIVEAFVRHHARHCDKIVVLDDGSTDGTYELLMDMAEEGLPLVVLSEPVIGYQQSRYMTRLMQAARQKFGADWILPLDADEFVEPRNGMLLSDVLRNQAPGVLELKWSNFVWRPEFEGSGENNPVLRMPIRTAPRHDHTKVLIHASVIDDTACLAQGNHDLTVGSERVPAQSFDSVRLCHYPIRSIAQYAGKVAIGFLQYAACPDWNGQWGFHYVSAFDSLARGGLKQLAERMPADSIAYSLGEESLENFDPKLVHEPLHYIGGALTNTRRAHPEPLLNVLQFANRLASELAESTMRAENTRVETAALRVALEEADTSIKSVSDALRLAQMRVKETEKERTALLEEHTASDGYEQEVRFLRRRISELELRLIGSEEKAAMQDRLLQSRAIRLVVRGHTGSLVFLQFLKTLVRRLFAAIRPANLA